MTAGRYVSDDDYLSFYRLLSDVLQMVMDLVYLTRSDVAAVLALQWMDAERRGISMPRIRSTVPKLVPPTKDLGYVLGRCRRETPVLADTESPHVITLKDGNQMISKEFNLLWKRSMRRWLADDRGRSAFSIRDIRMKGIADRKTGDLVWRRGCHAQRISKCDG
jgi:hypothetical protein